MLTFQVHVTAASKGNARRPSSEHLVDVLAADPVEAALVAAQMVACRPFADMPLAAEVVTDSTFTDF